MQTPLISLILLSTVVTAPAMVTYTYSVETNVGTTGTALSTDGWTGDDLGNWVAQSQNSLIYARNTNDGDDTIFRTNDGGFSYSIPVGTTSIILEIDARTPTFWEAGPATGNTSTLLIGGDFNNNDKFFISGSGGRISEAGTTDIGDQNRTLRLEYDLVNGTADLILDPNGSNTLLLDDVAISTTDLSQADSLVIRSGSRFSGPGNFRLTVIPEPSSSALLGLGCIALLLRKKR